MTRPGESFEDAEVARLYLHRPAYDPRVYDKLLDVTPGTGALLDLGCGTGKIARGLAHAFSRVVGIDASEAMLEVAARLDAPESNITWRHGLAETADLSGDPFDLVVAAASIHWMDTAVVFPRLAAAVARAHMFAVVDGDGAHEPPWQAAWDDFLAFWIYELSGERYEPERTDTAHHARITRYRHWVDIAGEARVLSAPVSQSIADFVACQHSRDTFAPTRLGARIRRFDAELAGLLRPYATDGRISYRVGTDITWGSIRS